MNTIISSWFDKSKHILNIPQPCCIIIDNINYLSDIMPNIFIYVEPEIIYNVTEHLLNYYNKYHTILTYNQIILDNCPNARKYIYGTTWINKEYYNYIDSNKKQFKISNLAGSKLINNSPGHLFRQIIHHNQNKLNKYPITFFRSNAQQPHITDYGDNPFLTNNKEQLFDEFQYSIIIENSQQTNYFTEKIVDCLITKTIPIYWGCPNISEYFDISGWIILETTNINELINKIQIIDKDYYSKYIDIIKKNYITSKKYVDFYDNINNQI